MFQADTFLNPDNKFRPLQIVHDFCFIPINVNENYGFAEGATEEEKLDYIRNRLTALKAKGFGGVVMNVAFERYLEDPVAWERFVASVDIAISLGLRIWIYDEQYYPTGTAGGIVLRDHPEFEPKALSCVTVEVDNTNVPQRIFSPKGHSSLQYAYAVPYDGEKLDFSHQIDITRFKTFSGGLCWNPLPGHWRLYCFFVRTHHEGTYKMFGLRVQQRFLDYYREDAIKCFLETTYEPYLKYLKERFADHIDAIFMDEPGFLGYFKYPEKPRSRPPFPTVSSYFEQYDATIPLYPFIHWTENFDEAFKAFKGYSMVENLPALFEGGEEYRQLRIDSSQFLSYRYEEVFVKQYREFLKPYNVSLSGHYRCTRHVGDHLRTVGDFIRTAGQLDFPGCDRLEPMDEFRNRIDCKLTSSAAHLYGNKKAMIGASNMYRPQVTMTPELMRCSIATDMAQGINIITSYYAEELFPLEDYQSVTTFVGRLGQLLDGGIHCPQALVYYPFKQMATDVAVMNIDEQVESDPGGFAITRYAEDMKKLSVKLMNLGVDFDYINDECLIGTVVEGDHLRTPNGETPSMLLLPDVPFVPENVAKVIESALAAGITVGVYGPAHSIEGLQDVSRILFFDDATIPENTDFVTYPHCQSLRYIHKRFDDHDLYLVVQTDPEAVTLTCSIPACGIAITRLNCVDATSSLVDARNEDGRLVFDLVLAPYEATVLMVKHE